MTSTAPQTQTRIDPLHAFMAGVFASAAPMPLIATRLEVVIDAGLAVVTTARTFRNIESRSIEATLTFPVPVHATLFWLQARIGERVLRARARSKSAARAEYEAAIDSGKTTVLHEEVLRGVHMLSVGHVPPAAEIEVCFRWAMTMGNIDGRGHLRIPLTVGDIYGSSGLPDCDELIHAVQQQAASLTVQCRDGTVTLRGSRLDNGQARVALDAPIDLEVAGWTPKDLRGRAADGREVVLRIEPSPSGERALDVALLVDHSGSMAEPCAFGHSLTKHAAVILALDAMAQRVQPADVVDLWEFNNTCGHVGSGGGRAEPETALPELIRRLGTPSGGTEIGIALDHAIAGSGAPDILLVTDGKSHALDVQSLARSGRRFSVVLIGEDSLEANVGHLAALSGGEIFIAAGHDIVPVMAAALRSLRVRPPAPAVAASARHWTGFRAGMRLSVSFGGAATAGEDTIEVRAIAAITASLVLPTLATGAAAALAEAEGLVTHLTSLVLVDEAGATQDGVPASRKVPLASPRTQAVGAMMPPAPVACAMARYPAPYATDDDERSRCTGRRSLSSLAGARPSLKGMSRRLANLLGNRTLEHSGDDLSRIAKNTNWDFAPGRLQAGDLGGLAPAVQEAIRVAAAKPEVAALANRLGLDPIVLVIALMAQSVARDNRSARRIARVLLPSSITEEQTAVARRIGLA
jgi:hypothetical protein